MKCHKWCWRNQTATCERAKLDHYLIAYIKTNSKWIKDLSVRPEIIKFLEENIGGKLTDIDLSDVLVDLTPKARDTKAKINKWDQIKLKIFCTVKETIIRMKRQPTEWEKTFANHIYGKC